MQRIAAAVSLLALASCGEERSPASGESGFSSTPAAIDRAESQGPTMTANTEPLADQISEYRAGFAQRAPQEMQTLFQQRVDDLAASGITERAVNVGDAAPGFQLPAADGSTVSLSTLLEQGPVVLNWYRGGWCPYCNLTLRAYQSRLDEIRALGATFVAITPETPDNSLTTTQKNELAYPVLTDLRNEVARSYGIVFKLPDDLAAIYNDRFDLEAFNGDDSNELPLAATFVIDTEGVVRYAFLSPDYRERAEPQEVIDALRTIASR